MPLENGLQCKIIQGFGNTICRRLEAKLAEHRSLQPNDGPGLDIPVSPVLQPRGQVPSSSSRSPTKTLDNSPADNFLQSNNSEDDDFKLALQLSQEEAGDREQEERDREMALRLQEELNRENVPPSSSSSRRSPSPPRVPFTFDDVPDRKREYQHTYDDEDDDLPDIPDVNPPDPIRQSLSPPKMNAASSFVSPTKLPDISKPGPSRQKPRVIHDISVVSDDEECVQTTTKTQTPRKKKTPTKSPGSGRKDYVPRQRSGAYAVLITLFHEKAKDEYRGFVSKAFLQVEL